MANRLGVGGRVLPHRDVRELVVVADRFAVLGLVLFAQVAPARLVADQRVATHELAQLEEVGDAAGILEALIERARVATDLYIGPEPLPDSRQLIERPIELLPAAGDPAAVEQQLAELPVEVAGRGPAVDPEQLG